MAVFGIILVAFIVFLFIYFYKQSKTRPENYPPGPPRLPVWGSYWFILKEDYTYLHKATQALAKRYKTNLLGFFLGPFDAVATDGYDICKEVLTREEFNGRVPTILTTARSHGELLGVIFTDGPYWKEQRRFSLRHLRDYGFGRRFQHTELLFEKELRDLIDMMMSEPKPEDSDICCKKGRVLIPEIFTAPSLNAILYMLIGRTFDAQMLRKLGRASLRFLRCSDATGNALTMTPWLRFFAPDFFGYTPIVKENVFFMKFFKEQILDHKDNLSDDHLADFTEVFLSKMKELDTEEETNNTFTEKQLMWVLIDYMFPSPVTIGQTMNYLVAYLLHYTEVQVKVQEEIDNVVGRSRLPTLDDRQNMPYTEAVIRETIRKCTLVPYGVPRRCLQDTMLGGYFIPKNTVLLTDLDSAHNDPKVWGDPENYRPERFLDNEGKLLKKDLTLGFGAGKRLCAGETFARQRLFLYLAGLMQNFTFKPAYGLPDLDKAIPGIVQSIENHWVDAISR